MRRDPPRNDAGDVRPIMSPQPKYSDPSSTSLDSTLKMGTIVILMVSWALGWLMIHTIIRGLL